jgi:hypothetical protein
LLTSYVTAPGELPDETREGRHVVNGALTAIAFHADPSADQALERFVTPSSPDKLR